MPFQCHMSALCPNQCAVQHFSQSLQFETSIKYAHAQKITRVAVFEYSGYLFYAHVLWLVLRP